MKKLLLSIMAIVFTVVNIFSTTSMQKNRVEAVDLETAVVYTIEDICNLQDFLLARETPDLKGKDYDLDNDGRWDVFDLCLMKRAYLNTRYFPADKSNITAQAGFLCLH